MIKDQTAPN